MAKKTPRKKTRPATPALPPVERTWTVLLPEGTTESVTAHDCDTFGGGATFSRILPRRPGDEYEKSVVVRAYARTAWRRVELAEPAAQA